MAREIVKSHSSSSIGSVKQSMLDEATFQSIHGTGWVLMDGRDLSVTNPGSAYETLTGQSTLPDARGKFLRGLDTSGTVDPDGAGRNLGSQQGHALQQHTHNYNASDQGSISAGSWAGTDPRWTETSGANSANVASETRPVNIAINIFIKINE